MWFLFYFKEKRKYFLRILDDNDLIFVIVMRGSDRSASGGVAWEEREISGGRLEFG